MTWEDMHQVSSFILISVKPSNLLFTLLSLLYMVTMSTSQSSNWLGNLVLTSEMTEIIWFTSMIPSISSKRMARQMVQAFKSSLSNRVTGYIVYLSIKSNLTPCGPLHNMPRNIHSLLGRFWYWRLFKTLIKLFINDSIHVRTCLLSFWSSWQDFIEIN